MSLIVTLVGPPGAIETARAALGGPAPTRWLAGDGRAPFAAVDLGWAGTRADAETVLAATDLDWSIQPAEGRRKRVLVCDMDSTIIGCECVDELAAFAGVGEEVAAITEQAMQGALDFEASLTARVARLAGVAEEVLARVYAERVRLNRGARALTATMRAHGATAALVSGGFTYFTARVAADAGFDTHRANTLEMAEGRLTGALRPPILGRAGKREALERLADTRGVSLADTIAIGDGANDRDMVEAAGLGVAYRAKPALAAAADARITSGDLRSALYFQGYAADEIAAPD